MAIILARMPHPVDFDPRLTCGLGASLPVPEPRTTIDSFGNRQAREDRNLRERRRSILSAGRPILNARYGSYAPQNQSFGAAAQIPLAAVRRAHSGNAAAWKRGASYTAAGGGLRDQRLEIISNPCGRPAVSSTSTVVSPNPASPASRRHSAGDLR